MQNNKELMCCEDSLLKLISDTHRVLEEWVLFFDREKEKFETRLKVGKSSCESVNLLVPG